MDRQCNPGVSKWPLLTHLKVHVPPGRHHSPQDVRNPLNVATHSTNQEGYPDPPLVPHSLTLEGRPSHGPEAGRLRPLKWSARKRLPFDLDWLHLPDRLE